VNSRAADINTYLAALPDRARATLEALRRTILETAPDAVESISYGMPTFKYNGKPLIYFGAAKQHLALYGTVEGTVRFQPDDPPSAARVQALVKSRIEAIEAGKPRRRSTKT
jgi:uncharacterized protein YdhG (YjbR/CyaY superfamily)